MIADVLEPLIDLLGEEYVLIQAWKKTTAYIRYHNWYSDTLELDRAAVNLPRFIAELTAQLKTPEQWNNDRLRMVLAPKSQQWRVTLDDKIWEPVEANKTAAKLRPLAHVSLKDQVAATAVMLCLANRVETIQGDPRDSITDAKTRRNVVSYGNRLFCEANGAALRHNWGSGKLYRAYYQDYQSFLARPAVAAASIPVATDARIVVVHSDLRQFYDRVRPTLIAQKLSRLMRPGDDPNFFALAGRLLDWEWDKKDSQEVVQYTQQMELSDFSRVALPQGLVAAGFFANVALLDFDSALRESLSLEIRPGVCLEDACRYVDDLRIVLSVDIKRNLAEIEQLVTEWLQELLDSHAAGLKPSSDKTRAAPYGDDQRPLVRQSRKMARIQSAISGGFDAIGGEEILDAVQGLIRSQQRYSEQRIASQGWPFSPVTDVRDATVARFAAARFRTTYRSLRPLLMDEGTRGKNNDDGDENLGDSSRVAHTQAELDDEARAFALGLIENWVEDPANVRLLRIGLDIWPAEEVLRGILDLLLPLTKRSGRNKAARLVACYCLSEIFRAGATETGFVNSSESLPTGIDIDAYRSTLQKEAFRLAAKPASTLPWYLRQQVLLFLASSNTTQYPILPIGRSPETSHYLRMIRFLRGEIGPGADFATFAILARRSFRGRETAVHLAIQKITPRRLEQIAARDRSFALEIITTRPELSKQISPMLRDDLCTNSSSEQNEWTPLAEIVLRNAPNGLLRNELAILRFASKFLAAWPAVRNAAVITPTDVLVKISIAESRISEIVDVNIVSGRIARAGSIYQPPNWCPADERWRFQLGYLMRFILAAQSDFTKSVRKSSWREHTATYRTPDGHWYQRLYGLFNGQAAFGDDWLPISDWTELLLLGLLRWPGCRIPETVDWVWKGINETRDNIELRIRELSAMYGRSSDVLMLPLTAPWPVRPSECRPLRACVVQTVIPTHDDFKSIDLTISNPAIRRRHRNHLSAALAAIARMLDLRATHTNERRLDWLILPELSVHPCDVTTHLVPFARAHKTIILAGLTYEALFVGKPLINSALWIIPIWSAAHGLQVLTRRQGKNHLAPDEDKLNGSGAVVQGFRPCQWLVGYEWSNHRQQRPLRLTSSVCYDATDLRLASDLRHQSDVFAIPALNKDVNVFDQMALALHYHMFQMVIVANNGLYGGSNAYAPYKESYVRQVFHLHGQPQASVAFLEINDIAAFIARQVDAKNPAPLSTGAAVGANYWKYPPAGL